MTTPTRISDQPLATYHNPVYDRSCPDPYVLKHCGEYWCYCTGDWPDGRRFGILHSADLVSWRAVGGAMAPLPGDHPCYWAPEVSYWQGQFYLYYSVGNETTMEIRVALADRPDGPFIDSGHRLTDEPFAIDPHVFTDDDGQRYLFYAVDFLNHTHIGTGTVMDRLLDPFTLAGQARPVTRARYDWQVYDPQRAEKGGVRWHTVEGSFVLKRKGHYYQLFSGGNWQNISYGVSYATTTDLNDPAEWTQVADGERVLPILQTLPDIVIGPGHNSVVRGPDNQQLFCVYHRWALDRSARLLAIDRLDWVGERLIVLGPSTLPQPAPIAPTLAGFDAAWVATNGQWSLDTDQALQSQLTGRGVLTRPLPAASFCLELTVRQLADASSPGRPGGYGLGLDDGFNLFITASHYSIYWTDGRQSGPLPADFQPTVDHLLRLEVNGRQRRLLLDGQHLGVTTFVSESPTRLALLTQQASVSFAGLALTVGWVDDFAEPLALIDLGWLASGSYRHWRIAGGELRRTKIITRGVTITKGPPLSDYELVVNARLDQADASMGGYSLWPAWSEADPGPLLRLVHSGDRWSLIATQTAGVLAFPLPAGFDPFVYQQLRCRKRDTRLTVQWAATVLGELTVNAGPTRVGLGADGVLAAFELVRVTDL